MIIKINRIGSDSKSKFEIEVNNEIRYSAEMSTTNSDYKSCQMFNADGSLCYVTSKNSKSNLGGIFSKNKKIRDYNIINSSNDICGNFYQIKKGFLSIHYVIENENNMLDCYDVSVGKAQAISIYQGDKQIAEIIKPLRASDDISYFYIFLLDEYKNFEKIISFFAIFFEYDKHHNTSDDTSYYDPNFEYTYSKNNKYYDKNWIQNNFNSEEVDLIYSQIIKK